MCVCVSVCVRGEGRGRWGGVGAFVTLFWLSSTSNPFLTRGHLKSETNCSPFFFFYSKPLFRREAKQVITKTYLYNFDPLKPHFYIVKLGFTGVYIIFLISAQNTDCGHLLKPPRRGGSNEYPQSVFCTEI